MAPKAGTLRAKVLEEIKRGPKTDEQLIDALEMNPSTLRPRRVELVNLGLIEPDGTALTKSGRKALLWRVK
jgi:DNA-binding IclR family transcriptional regulator